MAAQYLTLEEAANRLGIPTDELKRRLKTEWTHVVPMRDGPTLRFRSNQIDELARQLGAASDPDLPLAALEEEPAEPMSDDFKIAAPPTKGAKPADEPLLFDSSDDDIFSLSADEPKPTAPKPTTPKPAAPKKDDGSSDSDVRLEAAKPSSGKGKGKGGGEETVPTEEIALDLSGGPSSAVIKGGSSAKLSAPKSPPSPKSSTKLSAGTDSGKGLSNPGTGDSSEFELSLDADSDDFELQLNTDSSDEVDLGSSPVEEAGNKAGKSGINLRDPADSGVSLEKGKKGDSARTLAKKSDSSGKNIAKKADSGKNVAKKAETDSDSDVDFELSLEPEGGAGASAAKLGGPRSGGKVPATSDSDSEFELTLDDSGEGSSLEAAALEGEESKGDIFETDFEIPPMTDESGSEAVALESDTDLEADGSGEMALDEGDVVAEEETGSQVVVLEDEPDAAPATPRSRRKPAKAEDAEDVDLADIGAEEEAGESASAALRGVKARHREEDEEEAETVPSARAAPAPWGPLPALILFPAFVLVIIGGLMGYELLHTMMGYQQPRKPAAPIVRGMAKSLDMELKDQ
ncbi:MAG: hypothetical protein JWO38_5624 [Gemmataceae bacterium]|nr:hypothetical protein [Gemmataceae bacterium]